MEPAPILMGSSEREAASDMEALKAPPQEAVSPESEGSAWRDELAARLSRYRSRRKAQPPRYPSLRLPFEASQPSYRASEPAPVGTFEPISNQALALDGMRLESTPVAEPAYMKSSVIEEVVPPAQVVPHTTAKIIEFPRYAWGPPAPPPDQLAEPVMDRPRILEVPEVETPLPALGGITIEPAKIAEPEKRLGIDVPLLNASTGRRILAAFLDGLLVAAAAALFGFIFWKIVGVRPPKLLMIGASAGIVALLWAAYQYLLIVYSGSTPGLRAAGLQLTRFDGTPASRSLRRWRMLASYLSALSLGMGYAWTFLDEDALCWHDRITHTYLAPREPSQKQRR